MVRFTVLGRVGVVLDDELIPIGGKRSRAVLAVLCANLNEVVSVDKLLEDAWGGSPPASGANALRVQINQLRTILDAEADVLQTEPPGYRISCPATSLDASRYESAVALAEQVKSVNPERASQLLDEAERLWEGDPYPDIGDLPFADTERRRLERINADARACRFEVELELGRHHRVLAEIDTSLSENPYEERVWRSKMLALYRSGSQADAIRTYQELRDALGEIGLDPSPEASDLELRMLNHDPTLVATARATSNLPEPSTSLVGRHDEMSALSSTAMETRMVTLVGFGGIGKTRLALECARSIAPSLPGGAWFIDLTAVRPGETVVDAALSALGQYAPSADEMWDAFDAWLAEAPRLLVLDNCEQVAPEVSQFASRVLRSSGHTHMIATSRQRLGVPGEHVVHVEPLATTSDDAGSGSTADAMQLLEERALRARPVLDVEDHAEPLHRIVELLEGHPLATELAAARLRYLSPEELLERIDESMLAVLSDRDRAVPDRHRALESVLDTSWSLLSPAERGAMSRLALFRGGFTMQAASAVLPGRLDTEKTVVALVDASLLEVHQVGAATRYRPFETVRQFSAERLSSRQRRDAMRGHVGVFASLTRAVGPQLLEAGQSEARSSLNAESANIRAAIEYAQRLGEAGSELEIASSAANFWFESGQHRTGREVLSSVLADVGDASTSDEYGEVLRALVELSVWNGAMAEASGLLERQEAFASRRGTQRDHIEVLGSAGLIQFMRGDYSSAARTFTELVAEAEASEGRSRPYALASIAYLRLIMGDRTDAEDAIARAMASAEDLGELGTVALIGDFRGWKAFQDGNLEGAADHWLAAEEAYHSLGLAPMAADMRQLRAWAALELGETESLGLLASANEQMREFGLRPYVIRGELLEAAATTIADPARSLGDLEKCVREAASTGTRLNGIWALVYASRAANAVGRDDLEATLADAASELIQRVPLEPPKWLAWRSSRPSEADATTDMQIMTRALAAL